MAHILSGTDVAAALTERSRRQAALLADKHITPTLAIVRVGEQPGDLSYQRGAVKHCSAAGVEVKLFVLAADVPQQELLQTIYSINEDESIHGCLIFRPLPPHIDDAAVRAALLPQKDVDGITAGSLAGVISAQTEGFPACTPRACIEILDHFGIDLCGKKVTVVGRSLVVGRPLALLLLARDATVTVCHSRSHDVPALCREADIVIAAAGHAGLLGAGCFVPGQTVIDVGINYDEQGKLCGDVDAAAAEVAAARTPVPGGVGAVTSAVLAAQVIEAAWRSCN